MRRRSRRVGEGGFALVEVAISSLVLVVAISGLVVTTVYSRNLSESSKHLWHATNAASATLEEIRHQSTTNWSDVTNWNGVHCDYGVGDPIDPYASKLAAEVGDDDTVLDRSTGMWTSGATAPNFYFVQVHASSSQDEFANALDFQTYVADRAGLKNLSEQNTSTGTGGGTGGGGTGGGGQSTSASRISTTPTNVVSGGGKNDYTLSCDVTNGAPKNLIVTSMQVTSGKTATIGAVSLNGVPLYYNMSKPSDSISIDGVGTKLSSGIPPGTVKLAFDSPKFSFGGETVTVSLTFADGSTSTIAVKP